MGSAGTFDDISPIDETVIAKVHAGGQQEVDAAVAAAHDAFPTWAALPRPERGELLRAVADGVDKRAEELARVETRDNGSLLRASRAFHLPSGRCHGHHHAVERTALSSRAHFEKATGS